MSNSCTIKVEQPNITVEAQEPIKVLPTTNTPIMYREAKKVQVSPRSYHIVSPDLYTIKRNTEIPPWMEDQLNDIINGSDLAGDLGDLEDVFGAYKNEVDIQIYNITTDIDQTNAYVITLESEYDNNFAGIQQTLVTHASEFQSEAAVNTLVAAWSTDPARGGAWFQDSVHVVQNVAYSAAKSASNLTAVTQNQSALLYSMGISIETLQKQTDGRVVTWFGTERPITNGDPDGISGPINPTVAPYKCWLDGNICPEPEYDDNSSLDTRVEHTGDVYVWFKLAVDGISKVILATYRFGFITDTGTYVWEIFEDDLASQAYQAALEAQSTADGKITTFIGLKADLPHPEHVKVSGPILLAEFDKLTGDIWYQTDYTFYEPNSGQTHEAANTMFVYTKIPNSTDPAKFDYYWRDMSNGATRSSVLRLDEAVVSKPNPDYDPGQPISPTNKKTLTFAKSSLVVKSGDVVAGFVVSADASESSDFKIFADKFRITTPTTDANPGIGTTGDIFTVDTGNDTVTFNGAVTFNSVVDGSGNPVEDYLITSYDLAGENSTVIDGSNITTGYIRANVLDVNIINALGITASYINSDVLISGNRIEGAVIEGSVIKASYLDLDGELEVLTNFHITVSMYNGDPTFYRDSVPIYGSGAGAGVVDEYRIPTLSLVKDSTRLVTLENVDDEFYSNIFSYKTANVDNNNKCVKVRPVISCEEAFIIASTYASRGYCNKYAEVHVTVYLGSTAIFKVKAKHSGDCNGTDTARYNAVDNFFGTSLGYTYNNVPRAFTSAGIDFELGGSQGYASAMGVVTMQQGHYTAETDISNTGAMFTVKLVYKYLNHSASRGSGGAGSSQFFTIRNLN